MARKRATIIRAPHDSQNPYKAVRRATFDGSRLSFEARGVMVYLLMKPDDWEIDIADIQREGGIGRDKTYRILAELIAHRYVERVDERDKGKFGGASYLLYECPADCNQAPYPESSPQDSPAEPLPEKPDTEKPLPAKPDTDLPDTEKPLPVNPTQTNKGYSTKEGKETKEGGELSVPAPPPNPDVDFGGKQFNPKQTMYAALCEAVGWDYRLIRRDRREQAAQLVRDLSETGYTVDDIRRYMAEVWFTDWRWVKKQERPKLDDIREGIGVLRLGLPETVPRDRGKSGPADKTQAAADELRSLLKAHGKESLLYG